MSFRWCLATAWLLLLLLVEHACQATPTTAPTPSIPSTASTMVQPRNPLAPELPVDEYCNRLLPNMRTFPQTLVHLSLLCAQLRSHRPPVTPNRPPQTVTAALIRACNADRFHAMLLHLSAYFLPRHWDALAALDASMQYRCEPIFGMLLQHFDVPWLVDGYEEMRPLVRAVAYQWTYAVHVLVEMFGANVNAWELDGSAVLRNLLHAERQAMGMGVGMGMGEEHFVADVSIPPRRLYPVEMAIERENVDMLAILLRHGADVSIQDKRPWFMALHGEHIQILRLLLEHFEPRQLATKCQWLLVGFVETLLRNLFVSMRMLVQHVAEMETSMGAGAVDQVLSAFLMNAVEVGHVDATLLLLQQFPGILGTHAATQARRRLLPELLSGAVARKVPQMVELLLAYGADIHAVWGPRPALLPSTPLPSARDPELLEEALERSEDAWKQLIVYCKACPPPFEHFVRVLQTPNVQWDSRRLGIAFGILLGSRSNCSLPRSRFQQITRLLALRWLVLRGADTAICLAALVMKDAPWAFSAMAPYQDAVQGRQWLVILFVEAVRTGKLDFVRSLMADPRSLVGLGLSSWKELDMDGRLCGLAKHQVSLLDCAWMVATRQGHQEFMQELKVWGAQQTTSSPRPQSGVSDSEPSDHFQGIEWRDLFADSEPSTNVPKEFALPYLEGSGTLHAPAG